MHQKFWNIDTPASKGRHLDICCLSASGFYQGGFFYVPHPLHHVTYVLIVKLKDLWLSLLNDKQFNTLDLMQLIQVGLKLTTF
jgi:hypothetical protein